MYTLVICYTDGTGSIKTFEYWYELHAYLTRIRNDNTVSDWVVVLTINCPTNDIKAIANQ